ncbi:hypothetical protein ACS0TY_017436 [Phlomoides rotata]
MFLSLSLLLLILFFQFSTPQSFATTGIKVCTAILAGLIHCCSVLRPPSRYLLPQAPLVLFLPRHPQSMFRKPQAAQAQLLVLVLEKLLLRRNGILCEKKSNLHSPQPLSDSVHLECVVADMRQPLQRSDARHRSATYIVWYKINGQLVENGCIIRRNLFTRTRDIFPRPQCLSLKQLFQNVQMSVNFLVSLLKKNWQNDSSQWLKYYDGAFFISGGDSDVLHRKQRFR